MFRRLRYGLRITNSASGDLDKEGSNGSRQKAGASPTSLAPHEGTSIENAGRSLEDRLADLRRSARFMQRGKQHALAQWTDRGAHGDPASGADSYADGETVRQPDTDARADFDGRDGDVYRAAHVLHLTHRQRRKRAPHQPRAERIAARGSAPKHAVQCGDAIVVAAGSYSWDSSALGRGARSARARRRPAESTRRVGSTSRPFSAPVRR